MSESRDTALPARSGIRPPASAAPASSHTRNTQPDAFDTLLLNTEPGTSFHGLKDIVRKRKAAVISVFAVFVSLAALYCLVATRLYSATTTLEIRGYAPILQQGELEALLGRDTRRIEYQKTTIAKLSQLGLADLALSRPGIEEELRRYFSSRKSWLERVKKRIRELVGSELEAAKTVLRIPPAPPSKDAHFRHAEGFLRSYLGLFDVHPIHETTLVQLATATADPALSQRLANNHADVFIEHLRSERQSELRQNITALEQHAAELRAKLAKADEAVGEYARAHGLVAFANTKDENLLAKNISDVSELLTQTTAKRIQTESVLNELKEKKLNDASSLDDKTIEQLRLDLQQAEAEYASLSQKVTPLYPTLAELGAKIGALKRSIQSERSHKITGLHAELNSQIAAEQSLTAQVEKQRASANDAAAKLVNYNLLVREAESLRTLTDAVLKELKEAEISVESSKSNIFVSDYAALPVKPSTPKTQIIMVLAVILGSVAGIGLALLLEVLDNTMEGAEDAQRALGIPALGHVPTFEVEVAQPRKRKRLAAQAKDEGEKSRLPSLPQQPAGGPPVPKDLITITSPQAAVSEALRAVRASILFSSADNPMQILMVTSPKKGEGKTSVVTNLAVTLAQAGHRTLLIDADLRNSQSARYFGVTPRHSGLVDMLVGHRQLDDSLVQTSVENLFVLPPGSRTPNPAELLGSKRMGDLLKYLTTAFDFILLDAPPVLPVSDSLLLGRFVDATVFVVRSRQTDRPSAQEAIRRLRRVRINIAGVVVNGVSPTTPGYNSDYFSQYRLGEDDFPQAAGQ